MRLYTINAADWTDRIPVLSRKPRGSSETRDCEVICRDEHHRADRLHSRCFEHEAIACAFDLLRLDGENLRRQPLVDRKAALRSLLTHSRDGIQVVNHFEMDGDAAFEAACAVGLEGMVSKRLTSPYRSGPCKSWVKTRNPNSPANMRITDGQF